MIPEGHSIQERGHADLSGDLCRLLEKGLSLARAGHWAHVEAVAAQMEPLARSLAQADSEIDTVQRQRLKDLYGQLTVAVEAQRKETQAELKKLRGVKRAVGAYGE